MSHHGNHHILPKLAYLFGSAEEADCEVVFCQETLLTASSDPPPPKRRRLNESSTQPSTQQHAELFSEPLPVHRLVLRLASERFAAELARWPPTGERSQGRTRSASAAARPVQLRVPLSSAAEVPAARAAIKFAYTGEVAASSSLPEILEIRRQAAYLQIQGCVEACDEVVKDKLVGPVGGLQQQGRSGPHHDTELQRQQAALELFGCHALWSGAEAEPSLAAALDVAKRLLVAHFADALRTLNTPVLLERFTALPAVAVEAVLRSDQFGTDSESSVLLLLATWMKDNFEETSEQVRQRLCRRLRLAHLSRPYLSLVVPALAADHEGDPEGPEGWFPLGVTGAAFVFNFTVASDQERQQLVRKMRGDTFWFHKALTAGPRRQCIPPGGLTYGWHLPQQELQRALARLQEHMEIRMEVAWDLGVQFIAAGGFRWALSIRYSSPATEAGVFVRPTDIPALPERVRLYSSSSSSTPVYIPVSRRIDVNERVAGGGVELEFISITNGLVPYHGGRGWRKALRLHAPSQQQQQPQPQPQQQSQQNAGGASEVPAASLLSAWSDYLIDGKMTGTLTLLPP